MYKFCNKDTLRCLETESSVHKCYEYAGRWVWSVNPLGTGKFYTEYCATAWFKPSQNNSGKL